MIPKMIWIGKDVFTHTVVFISVYRVLCLLYHMPALAENGINKDIYCKIDKMVLDTMEKRQSVYYVKYREKR